ncbi:MAG: Septum formation initiator [Candidatus Parcubacteria bacterium]|jgi:cell division protein FtsB
MKKVLFLLVCITLLFIIHGLFRSILTLWEKKDVYVAKQQELERVKKENTALKAQEKTVTDAQFAEKEIRNKLFMVQPDENVVVLPADVGKEAKTPKKRHVVAIPVYEQWISLFVKGY